MLEEIQVILSHRIQINSVTDMRPSRTQCYYRIYKLTRDVKCTFSVKTPFIEILTISQTSAYTHRQFSAYRINITKYQWIKSYRSGI